MTNVARLVLQMDLLLFDTKFDSMLFSKYLTSRLLCSTHAVAFEKYRYLNTVEYLDYS